MGTNLRPPSPARVCRTSTRSRRTSSKKSSQETRSRRSFFASKRCGALPVENTRRVDQGQAKQVQDDQLHGQRLLSTFVHHCVQGCSRICYRGDPLATRGVRGHDEATAPEEPRRRKPGHTASHWETTALSLGVTDTVVRPLTAGEMNIEIRPHRISLPQRSVDEEDMGAEILASTWTSTCW